MNGLNMNKIKCKNNSKHNKQTYVSHAFQKSEKSYKSHVLAASRLPSCTSLKWSALLVRNYCGGKLL